MLAKQYQPAHCQARIYEIWEKAGAFRAGAGARKTAKPYSIVIPPPNVTGVLHMGHALNNTLQDILVRYRRMQGFDVLWQPGIDHAGIATQMVVERKIETEGGPSRKQMGRKKFVERVWQWKGESGAAIIQQLRQLGASCDWSRERFTLDDGMSHAVRKVFVELYRQGLIYRDERLVNWDPKLHTAISDLEVQPVECQGHLWHFRYPLEDAPEKFLTIATTRPETMFGDVAVAVHPQDARFQDYLGKHCLLPLIGRRIPIIGDAQADPDVGSGAVKITPAHDFNDFALARRHHLTMINIFDESACLNENTPQEFQGLDRYRARELVVARMQAAGLVEKITAHHYIQPTGDRSGVVIEPFLTKQWYVDARSLAKPAISYVEQEKISFTPAHWRKTYFQWMREIEPWCISRQLWWGHQIPAWYGADGHVFVALDETEAQAQAQRHYGWTKAESSRLRQDDDVLDTWFSSALWPFSTLGWPQSTPALKKYYPTTILVTGFDIIFFWVARMIMMGLHFMRDEKQNPLVPFHQVYVHALVRDEKGAKMSKSKGNSIDPVALIDTYGADALRFTLAAMAAPGRDVKLSESRVGGYRNFVTKIWNAARFCQMQHCLEQKNLAKQPDFANLRHPLSLWISARTIAASKKIDAALEELLFNEAANTLYHFVWDVFCDWHLELAKPILQDENHPDQAEIRQITGHVLQVICRISHPFMPFMSEQLWQTLFQSKQEPVLITAAWPQYHETDSQTQILAQGCEEIDWVIGLIEAVRSLKSQMGIPAGARIALYLQASDPQKQKIFTRNHAQILRLAGLGSGELTSAEHPRQKGLMRLVLGDCLLLLAVGEYVDLNVEAQRLEQEALRAKKDCGKLEKKLTNQQFLQSAPDFVIAQTRSRYEKNLILATQLQDIARNARAGANETEQL